MEPRVFSTDDVTRARALISRLRQLGMPEATLEAPELWVMEREEEIQNAQKKGKADAANVSR